MSGHVPPHGAEAEIDRAALAYLEVTQTATGTSHKSSVMLVAMIGVTRVARDFGVSKEEVAAAIEQMRALSLRGGQ